MNAMIAQTLRDIADLHKRLFGLIEGGYRVGTKVSWVHKGKYTQEGEVCYLFSLRYDQVKVRNSKTGKEQWLCIERVRLI